MSRHHVTGVCVRVRQFIHSYIHTFIHAYMHTECVCVSVFVHRVNQTYDCTIGLYRGRVKINVLTYHSYFWFAPADSFRPTQPNSSVLVVRVVFCNRIILEFTVSYMCASRAHTFVISISNVVTSTKITSLFTRADCQLIGVPYKLYCGVQILSIRYSTHHIHLCPFKCRFSREQLDVYPYKK